MTDGAMDPLVGWRIWNVGDGRLQSWAVDYAWRPGENLATCLTRLGPPCDSPPGEDCQCGFWAVWRPMDCAVRASTAREPPWHVMGLIAGWGAVALHGHEGFRAERAAVLCLFTDRPWAAATRSPCASRWWRRALGVPPPLESAGGWEAPERPGLDALASRYGVPLVSLRSAVGLGLLGELGVSRGQVGEAARLAARRADG